MLTFIQDIIGEKKYLVLMMSIVGIPAVLGTRMSFFSCDFNKVIRT
ncbi:hypothetical protein [Thalassobacillus hwangdonensis]|uniref:Uncharacterized protein n=1 Tax=Thalassobacillus hwangdonensis TaxID=546108 RepID=A0ABW3KZR6_9BACI